jgi:hypothetical protein
MTRPRNVMMLKRPDFGATIGNADREAKRQANADEETVDPVERCVLDSGSDRGET